MLLFYTVLLKILSGMANSVHPDQTTPSSGSALFAYTILLETLVYEILGHLPYLVTAQPSAYYRSNTYLFEGFISFTFIKTFSLKNIT